MLLRAPVYPFVSTAHDQMNQVNDVPTVGDLYNTYPTRVDATNNTFLGFNHADLTTLALYGRANIPVGGDMDQGDDTSPYFDLGPRQATLNGIFNYACLRNNDFSNRDQKAQIYVSDQAATFAALGMAGGVITDDSGDQLVVPQGAFTGTITVSMLSGLPSSSSSFNGAVGSNYVTISPHDFPLVMGRTVHIRVKYDDKVLITPTLYHSDTGLQGSSGQSWIAQSITTVMLKPMSQSVEHMSFRRTSIGVPSSVSSAVPSPSSVVSLD